MKMWYPATTPRRDVTLALSIRRRRPYCQLLFAVPSRVRRAYRKCFRPPPRDYAPGRTERAISVIAPPAVGAACRSQYGPIVEFLHNRCSWLYSNCMHSTRTITQSQSAITNVTLLIRWAQAACLSYAMAAWVRSCSVIRRTAVHGSV